MFLNNSVLNQDICYIVLNTLIIFFHCKEHSVSEKPEGKIFFFFLLFLLLVLHMQLNGFKVDELLPFRKILDSIGCVFTKHVHQLPIYDLETFYN